MFYFHSHHMYSSNSIFSIDNNEKKKAKQQNEMKTVSFIAIRCAQQQPLLTFSNFYDPIFGALSLS